MTILDKIIEQRRIDIATSDVEQFQFERVSPRPSLIETIRHSETLQVIAEVKRASPSKGLIALDVDPIAQAKQYEASGAACISVLTEPQFFKGSYDDLHEVASNVAVPVLCKDFIVEKVQIDIAKKAGATVILLIVTALSKEEISELFDYATSLGLEVLVEVHTIEELQVALAIGAQLVGVNNRNLKTFDVDLAHTKVIADALVNSDVLLVSESGIVTKDDATYLADCGARALLIGETFMRTANINETMQQFKVPVKVGEQA